MDKDVSAGSATWTLGHSRSPCRPSASVTPKWGAYAAAPLTRGAYALLFVAMLLLAIAQFGDSAGLAKVGGWLAAAGGLVAWYAATAALAHWPTALPGRAAGRGVTATG